MRIILTAFTALMLLGTHAFGEVLITPREAALPPRVDVSLELRGLTRGPSLDQISPKPAMSVRSPFALKIKFTAHNNSNVDSTTMKASYLKLTPIDLTERLRKYTSGDGIDMPDAEVPPGAHLLRIELKDSLGRTTVVVIKLIVE
ncbi:MAG: hypothetical protein ACLP0B_04100 [Steroidobacteraceae bacterium]|jgi:hypothetical protein